MNAADEPENTMTLADLSNTVPSILLNIEEAVKAAVALESAPGFTPPPVVKRNRSWLSQKSPIDRERLEWIMSGDSPRGIADMRDFLDNAAAGCRNAAGWARECARSWGREPERERALRAEAEATAAAWAATQLAYKIQAALS